MRDNSQLPKKLIFKKAVSGIFSRTRFLRRDSEGFRVLNYHSIPGESLKEDADQMTTPKEYFARQLKYLNENRYNVISCGEAVKNTGLRVAMPPRSVCITFDDGFKDNLTNALPALEKYGFKATIFPAVDYIGKNSDFLAWDEIKGLSKTGLISFGAHSLSHRRLSSLNDNDLEREAGLSKSILEDNLGMRVDLFAYPFGSYGSFDGRAEQILMAKGYKAAFTTIAGSNTAGTDLFRLRRTRISWYDDEKEFPKELAGDYDWYRVWQMADGYLFPDRSRSESA